MSSSSRETNHETFRDCFSAALLERITKNDSKSVKKARGRRKKTVVSESTAPEDNEGELAEFIEFLADEIFPSLPPDLQDLSFSSVQNDPDLLTHWSSLSLSTTEDSILPLLPPSIHDSISSYALLPETSFGTLLHDALSSYISQCTSAPPLPGLSRGAVLHCEICDRDWLPLTYHHLIPRSMHEKVRKRGWHPEWELSNVAWLCRACHSFVHKVASNEDLARTYFTVEKLLEREDVRRWAGWVGTVRWKAR